MNVLYLDVFSEGVTISGLVTHYSCDQVVVNSGTQLCHPCDQGVCRSCAR